MTHDAKLFWWPKIPEEIQQKYGAFVPCKMTGKSIKPQLPMSEINYLPPADKSNQEIRLDYIGLIRYKQRQFLY